SLTSGPEWLGISETGELGGTPANEHVGDSLMIIVSFTDGVSTAESVLYISVENTNDAPVVTEPLADVEVNEDAEPLTIDLSQVFGDEDAGDSLGYSVQGYLTFRKIDFADWTLEENQDRVADNVWLTRQNSQSIFNIALEDAYSSASQSPVGTEWAYGHAAHTEGLTFQHFKAAVNNSPPSSIGKPLVLHTIDEDAYYDIMVHHWAGGSPGGGFAWTRSSGEVPIMTPEINGSNLVLHFHPNASGETELVIVATDQSGATALDTMGITVNPVNDSPGDFTLLVPENNSVVSDLTPTFTWDTPVDPDNSESMGEIGVGESSDKVTTINHTQVATRSIESYNVYIGIAPDFTPEDVVATVSTNYYTHEEELEENEVYYWMIEAVDNDGGGTISDTWSFTINSENLPPSLFALISPDSGVILNTQEVNFEWEASVDMDPMDGVHYSIDIHSDTTHIHFETESTSIASGNLMDNSIYHWGVRAFDMYGGMTENIGGPDMFVINVANDAPSAASLVAPLDGSIQTNLSPNFFWTRSFDPDPMDHVSYSMDVWAVGGTESQSISTDSNGVTIDFALMDNSMYGFQVIAFDIDDGESQSDTSHFYTDAFPEPPLNFTTVSPQNESQGLATEVEFKWNMTQDPDPVDDIHYQLVYATNWDDSSTYVYSALVQDTSLTLTLEDDNQYFWLVEARDTDEFVVGSNNNTPMTLVVGTLGIDGHQIPEVFALHQNYPNPFNPTTTIRYDLPEPTQVRIHIVDIIGRKVSTIVNEHQNPGFKSVVWDALDEFGSPVGAGMYFYIIEAGEFQQTRKMILLK
ncbi:MAG: T9SS type A sorting domain-containing protein, partial [Candidatus Marinimicrobia bacterium]|nr:T9SS type A sorting domain-containing protein [Candidatus Neomarinimicrobiota bacterium]